MFRLSIAAIGALALTLPAVAQTSRPEATTKPETEEANPAAEGFDLEGSDAKAIEIADLTMEAMGGRDAWDATRYITWTFFGSRRHAWDKHENLIRVETERDGVTTVIVMDMDDGTGKAWRDEIEITDEVELDDHFKGALSAWINDAYWLVMPYKLKDSGVTLKYEGEKPTARGKMAHVLELTFSEVGLTPNNKYLVYVGRDSELVEQWDFYRNADDGNPGFQIPWLDWTEHGDILLSGDRGERNGRKMELTDIAVHDELPAWTFTSRTAPETE